ncbi:hypothetical protein ACQJBY_049876 [Aegilops geniculata]
MVIDFDCMGILGRAVEKLWGTCVLLAPAADQSGNRARRPSRHHLLLWSRQPWSRRRQPSSVASKLIQDKGEGPNQPADVPAAATRSALGAQG